MGKRSLRVAVSLLLMAALLTVFFWNVDLGEVLEALERCDPGMIVVAVALALFGYWFRAVRWQIILRPAGKVRHSSAVLSIAVGYAAMTLLPARMGDLVRPIVLSRRDRLPLSATLASMLTERILDLWTVVLYFLVFLVWPPAMMDLDDAARSNFQLLRLTGYAVGLGLVLGTLVLIGLLHYQDRFVNLVTRPVARIKQAWRGPVANFLNHFLDGLRVLQRPRDLAVTVGASLLLWYIIYWQVQAALVAFGLHLPLRATYLLVAIAVIGLAIPTPGGVGGFHKAMQVGLTAFFAVDLNDATAIAIVHHAICFLPITVIGLLCLPLAGVRLREVDDLAAEVGEP
jgi:glycosyltransferase 2 family protein